MNTRGGGGVRLCTHIPYEKLGDPYFFSCQSYAPLMNYVPLKAKLENTVCKISQRVFELESVILWLMSG